MDFGKMMQVWQNALTKPNETFAAEAKNDKVGLMDGVIGYGIAAAIMSVVNSVIQMAISLITYGFSITTIIGGIFAIPISFVVSIIGLLIGAGIMHIIASILGGKGTYGKLVYLYSLFAAPLMIVGIASIVPCLGSIIMLAVGLYSLYLLTLAIKANYALDTMKAVIVWLIPLIVLTIIMVVAIALFAGAAVLGGLLG